MPRHGVLHVFPMLLTAAQTLELLLQAGEFTQALTLLDSGQLLCNLRSPGLRWAAPELPGAPVYARAHDALLAAILRSCPPTDMHKYVVRMEGEYVPRALP